HTTELSSIVMRRLSVFLFRMARFLKFKARGRKSPNGEILEVHSFHVAPGDLISISESQSLNISVPPG
ncbi:hypothetical protein Tco_0244240, partial [Tanacetum coccineum]